jgi:hypothetical protein
MEKFLCRTIHSDDILTSLTRLKGNDTSVQLKDDSSWNERKSLSLIECRYVEKENSKPKNGWTSKNGEKVYATYRNGERITATGQEAMKLSIGDKKNNKRKSLSTQNDPCSDKQSKRNQNNLRQYFT